MLLARSWHGGGKLKLPRPVLQCDGLKEARRKYNIKEYITLENVPLFTPISEKEEEKYKAYVEELLKIRNRKY